MIEVVSWEVVGGADKGGIIVRVDKETSSEQCDERLSHGSIVEELEVTGDRLRFRIISGKGPITGWVSTKLKEKELMSKTDNAKKHGMKLAEERGKKNAENGPGPHNGPTLEALQAWLSERLRRSDDVDSKNEYAKGGLEASEMNSTDSNVPLSWLSRYELTRVANFRDVAGPDANATFKCAGGKIRSGLLFRTGQWNSATLADLQKIRDVIGIKTYIDLRNGETFEAGRAPCYDMEWYPPCPSGRQENLRERCPGELRRIHCPFTKGLKLRAWTAAEKAASVQVDSPKMEDRKETCSWWYQQLIRQPGFTDLRTSLSATMRAILLMNHDEVLQAMRVMTDLRNFPVAFGCMAGKDRTGLLSQLVLSALGVSHDDIVADYLATNDSSAHISACIQVHMALWHAELKEHQPKVYGFMVKQGRINEGEVVRSSSADESPLWQSANVTSSEDNLASSRVYKEIMEYTFHVLDVECGGVVKYLDSIGFGSSDIERMRAILVEPECNL